jgi:DNA-binding CsgD family transcriptional regulator
VAETAAGDWPGLFEARANSLLNLASDLIALDRLADVPAVLDRAAEATERDEFMRWRNANRLLLCRGELALARGDGNDALSRAEESLIKAEEKRAAKYAAQAHYLAGRALSLAGDHAAALGRLERGVAIAGEIGHHAGRWRMLASMSATLSQLGRGEEAAEHLADAWHVVESIADGLRDAGVRAEFLSSRAVQALSHACALGISSALSAAAEQSTGKPSGLTPREVEVLQCVARGLTNREIATILVISERTVNSHLVHIFNKLEVNSRAAATAHALRLGLVI